MGSNDATPKLAGPFHIESSVLARDAMIRENNDGKPIDDKAVCEYVSRNKEEIFTLQASFFAELRKKDGAIQS